MLSSKNKEPVIDTVAGIRVADHYRWLEDASDKEVKQWISAQNAFVDVHLKDKQFSKFSEELTRGFKTVSFSVPLPVKGKYFYTERQPDEDQSALYMKKGLDGIAIQLYNPNGRREGDTLAPENLRTTGRWTTLSIQKIT